MLKLSRDQLPLFDLLEVGISILTWDMEDLEKMEWVYVNNFRCSMTGFTREEIVTKPITIRSTREARKIYETQKAHIAEHGSFRGETTLLHKNLRPVPVVIYLKLVELDGVVMLLSEFHDISTFKQAEDKLQLSRQSLNEMLALIEQQKGHLTETIQGNLGRVVFPLIDQLKISATEPHNVVLDLMDKRITEICQEVGFHAKTSALGANLTKRQALICEMIRDGMTSKDIALALDCSPSTIHNHRNAIRKRLQLSGPYANLTAYLNSPG